MDRAHFIITNTKRDNTREPYPFQKDAMKALDELKERHPYGYSTLLVLPTGAGKTYTAVHWIIQRYVDEGVKVLWIAHRSELLRQAAETFASDTSFETLKKRDQFTSCVISSEFGRSCNIKSNYDVVIASRQSIVSGDNLQYYTKWAKGKDKVLHRRLLIVLDEAHHAAAQSYKTIIDKMRKFIPHLEVLGLTATPERTAKQEQGSLKKIFNTETGIAYSIDISTLTKLGILAEQNQIEVKTAMDMSKTFSREQLSRIAKYDITNLDEKTLQKITKNSERNKLIVDTYLINAQKFGKTLVFAIDVTNAIALNAIFRSKGVRSDYVVSGLVSANNHAYSINQNSEVINAFRNNELDVLINVNILTEGTDIPDIETVFLARPTTSRILMTQMVGRGLRKTTRGKTAVNIVSFIDDWRGLVSFVSPKELFDGNDEVRAAKKALEDKLIAFINCCDIEKLAVNMYDSTASIVSNVNNIYPYGVISCSYLCGEDEEYHRDILVYDEAKEIYEGILSDIEEKISLENPTYSDRELRMLSTDIYFAYMEKTNGKYIGVSSEMIYDLAKSYLANGVLPEINLIENRVDLSALAAEIGEVGEEQFSKEIDKHWNENPLIRKWYSREYYEGLMHVYYARLYKKSELEIQYETVPKEDMDLGTLEKYYPEYKRELEEYVCSRAYDAEKGVYRSAEPDENGNPIESPQRDFFEIDHKDPMANGGKSIKENLQLLTRKQNRKKGAKKQKK